MDFSLLPSRFQILMKLELKLATKEIPQMSSPVIIRLSRHAPKEEEDGGGQERTYEAQEPE